MLNFDHLHVNGDTLKWRNTFCLYNHQSLFHILLVRCSNLKFGYNLARFELMCTKNAGISKTNANNAVLLLFLKVHW